MSELYKRTTSFLKNWALPISMATGICAYLIYHWSPSVHMIGPYVHDTATFLQPILIFMMLFLQFNKISPHDLKFSRWHLALLCLQGGLFLALAFIVGIMPHGSGRILVESAMLCFITPTATAAGVITDKLGGSLSKTMTYVALSNCLAAVLVPTAVPYLHPVEGQSFISSMMRILGKVFPMLILPCLAAWVVRYTMRKVQIFLMRYAGMAFYLWCISLAISMALTTRTLLLSHMSPAYALIIGVISLICCIMQFSLGHRIGAAWDNGTAISAGQALGQKNTVFQIWLGYSFLSPETSIGGGFYCIWHNLVNSYELMQKRHKDTTAR